MSTYVKKDEEDSEYYHSGPAIPATLESVKNKLGTDYQKYKAEKMYPVQCADILFNDLDIEYNMEAREKLTKELLADNFFGRKIYDINSQILIGSLNHL